MERNPQQSEQSIQIENDLNNLRLRIRQSISNESFIKLGDFHLVERLGGGAYGDVYKAIHVKNQRKFAIKIIDKDKIIKKEPNQGIRTILQRLVKTEGELMQMCSSPYVLKCYEIIENAHYKIFVLEYCNRKSMHDELIQRKTYPVNEALAILKQLILGLSELHRNKIIHRDLKAENIFIHNGKYKIGDFGLSKKIPSEDTIGKFTILGTKTTMAPEVRNRQNYGVKADIWSLGVIFFTMICSNISYPLDYYTGRPKEIRTQAMKRKNPFFFETLSGIPDQQLQSFLKGMLEVDQSKRMSWRELIGHSIFKRCDNLFMNPVMNPSIEEHQVVISVDMSEQEHEEALLKNNREKIGQKKRKDLTSESPSDLNRQSYEAITQQHRVQQQMEDIFEVEIVNRFGSYNNIFELMEREDTEQKLYKQIQENNLECQKSDYILHEIIEVIQKHDLLTFKRKSHWNLLYMMITRCYLNCSWAFKTLNHNRHQNDEMFMSHYQQVKSLYEETKAKHDEISKQLTEQDKSLYYSFIHKKKTLFSKEAIMQQEDRFLEGNEGIDYQKSEQIEQTQSYFIGECKVIDDLDSTHPKYNLLKRNLQNYQKINELTIQQLRSSQKNFKQTIFNLIIQA